MDTSATAHRRTLTSRFAVVAGVIAGALVVMPTRAALSQSIARDGKGGLDEVGLPLRPTRIVRFQVGQGTWMSLDVSPDGRTIVFDLLGDLYALPITGGRAQRLTRGTAFNQQPRYSPDGQHLVFVSDRSGSANVWLTDQYGRHPRQLSALQGAPYGAVTSPTWSPDGSTIVVSQVLGATRSGLVAPTQEMRWLLAAYDVATGGMRWISDTSATRVRSALGAAFGAAQHAIYFAIDGFREDFFSESEDWRIARVNQYTGQVQLVMAARAGRIGVRPAISRDGRYLVYATSSGSHMGFRLRDLHTDHERWLVREVLTDPPLATGFDTRDQVPGYAFTPDARFVIAAYGGKIHRIDVARGHASVIPFTADVERGLGSLTIHQFTLPDTGVRVRSVMQPSLSPDGRCVAFSALDRLWVMELPHGGRPTGLPYRATADSAGEFYPSWSPDGRWIAYSTWIDGEGGSVRRVPVTDERTPQLSERLTLDTAMYFHTAVSPDGRRVVATRAALVEDHAITLRASADPVLVWVPSTGGLPTTIASLGAQQHGWYHERYPADQVYFSADPERIYVGLTSWRWDGGDRQVALVVTGLEDGFIPHETAGVVSPDKSRALITRRSTLFELELPVRSARGLDTLDLQQARNRRLGTSGGATRRWGTALAPWISWSRGGHRVLFNQGGTLFVGDVTAGNWTSFARIDVPLIVPVDAPRGIIVLRGARLITMRGRQVIEHGAIVVRDNRIAAIGTMDSLKIPEGAAVLDLQGMTILPGYVDIHDHMRLPKGIHPQQCWQCLVTLAYGVTTSRDPQPAFGVDVFTYRERERMGEIIGPRIFSTGIAYSVTDPPIRNLDDARDAIRPNAEYFGSETFKVYPDRSTGRRARQLLTMALAERKLNATIHQQGADIGLTALIDGFSGLEHSFPNRIYDDVASLVARSGTTHTQTYALSTGWQHMIHLYGGLWEPAKMRRFAPPSARSAVCNYCGTYAGTPELADLMPTIRAAAQIAAKGGRVGLGAHGDIPGLGPHYEMWTYALGGMPAHEVLRSATIIGATAIGHANDFGSLERGKLADLQILSQNPLDDIHHTTSIRYVMKNGRLYRAEDLTELWPRHHPLAPKYLWEPMSSPDSVKPVRCRALSDARRLQQQPTVPTR
jgi:hypothetical protein